MSASLQEASPSEPQLTAAQHNEAEQITARWRLAYEIASQRPDLDAGDIYHALRNLELPPHERLRRGLTRVRIRTHAG